MSKCFCFFCKLHRKMNMVVKNGSHQQKNKLIVQLMDLWCHADADLNYENAIAEGSWPSSVEILEYRLEKAKKFKEDRLDRFD